jgi:hypothetical protein
MLLIGWLGATAWAFWWFDGQYRRAFSDSVTPFAGFTDRADLSPELLTALNQGHAPGVTLVHFRDDTCPCARFNALHVADITERYRPQGLRVITVDAADSEGLAGRLAAWLPVPASPAALVVGADGGLAYFGPYSTGAGCLTGSGTFVERAIERALRGPTEPQLNVLSVGCYCAWPGARTAAIQPEGGDWS